MKRFGILAVAVLAITSGHAQKSKVTTTYYALEASNLADAKRAIDEAVVNETTIADPKAWYYYSETYIRIFLKTLDSTVPASEYLDPNPMIKALTGYQKAIQFDPELKFRRADAMMVNWIGIAYGLMAIQNSYHNQGVYYLVDSVSYVNAYLSFSHAAEVQKMRATHLDAVADTALMYYNGYSASRIGKDDEALEMFEQLLAWKFKFENFYDELATLYVRLGRVDDALDALAVGETMYPKLIIARLNIYIQTNQLETRLAEFEKATTLEPANVDLHYALGTIYNTLMDSATTQGQTDKEEEYLIRTVATYEKVLALSSKHHGANYNLGVLYFNDAMEIVRQMNALPRSAQAEYDRLDKIRESKLKQALPYLIMALEAKPEDDGTKRALRQAYVHLNMLEEATKLDQ